MPERPRKISIDQCRRQGDTELLVYCMNHAVQYGGCFHSATVPLLDAFDRWGGLMRLDEIPFVCSACGSRNVDVRSDHPRGIGGSPFGAKVGPVWPFDPR